MSGEDHEGGRLPRAGAPLYKRFAIAGVLIFFLTTGAVSTAALLRVQEIAKEIVPPENRVHIDPKVIVKAKPGKPQTLLLVGSDKRFGAGKGDARSDTMMLVRLDPKQQATAVMSVPRDLVTEIPGYGTEKINGAYSYGGLNLTLKTVGALLSRGADGLPGEKRFEINHAIGVSFRGFRSVVNYVGCVYTDVDRRYYHSNAGLPPSAQYAEIDIQPGYQKLCGQRALDYVRFRHADSDIVRAARQQDFLRSAKNQIGSSRLIDDIDPLAKIIGKSTEADANLGSVTGILRLMKLALASKDHPVREIQFPATFVNNATESYVTATPAEIAEAVDEFLHAKAAAKPRSSGPKRTSTATKKQRRKSAKKGPTSYAKFGLVLNKRPAEDLVVPLAAKGRIRFPVMYAKAITPSGRYPLSTENAPMPRAYTIRDRADRPHRAYRIVVVENELEGQYYGIQGTTWKHPPILDGDVTKLRMRGRDYELHYDGKRLRTIAWRTSKAVYWVSNTLSLKLSNNQMRGLARSLTRIGEK